MRARTIHLDQTGRLTKKRPFSLMVKPVGSFCNLKCSYCYYSPVSTPVAVMEDKILKRAIEQTIFNNDTPEISFCWHGGEPLLAQPSFFEKVIAFQNETLTKKIKKEAINPSAFPQIVNTLQTNGTLIDEKWSRFFHKHNFLIGLSLDGPKDIYDSYRLNISGDSVFDKTMRGLNLLIDNGVEFNTLSTVNAVSKGRGAEVYNFLKKTGSRVMQFLPVVAPNQKWETTAQDYGQFMIDIFNEWWKSMDSGEYYVQLFDVALANYMSLPGGLCQFSPVCGDVPVLEHDGRVYNCDHFVNDQNYLGNIEKIDAKELFFTGKFPVFGIDKFTKLPRKCKECNYLNLCYGGCPEHRISPQENDFNLNYLCPGYKMFFEHVSPYLQQMANYINE